MPHDEKHSLYFESMSVAILTVGILHKFGLDGVAVMPSSSSEQATVSEQMTPMKKRRISGKDRDQAFDNVIEDQMNAKEKLLVEKLKNKQQLLLFLLGFIESGRLEAAWMRRQQKENDCSDKLFAPSAKYTKQLPVVWRAKFIFRMNAHLAIPDEATEEEAK